MVPSRPMGRKRILVVDDEPSIRTLLRDAISSPDTEIIMAENAARAMAMAEQHGSLDLVVTDIHMPGMDGLELAEHLAARGRATKFLFISGYYDRLEFVQNLTGFACADFLEKPFSIPELLRVVRILLTRGTSPSASAGQSRSFG
jgi:CheY-like chemotaxis protein